MYNLGTHVIFSTILYMNIIHSVIVSVQESQSIIGYKRIKA